MPIIIVDGKSAQKQFGFGTPGTTASTVGAEAAGKRSSQFKPGHVSWNPKNDFLLIREVYFVKSSHRALPIHRSVLDTISHWNARFISSERGVFYNDALPWDDQRQAPIRQPGDRAFLKHVSQGCVARLCRHERDHDPIYRWIPSFYVLR